MKTTLPFLFLSFICFNLTRAQITITSSEMPASGDTIRYSTASVLSIGNYTTTGTNYTWDFSALSSTGQGIRNFAPSSSTPYFFYFFPPKYGEKITDSIPIPAIPFSPIQITVKNIYSFYKNQSSSFNSEGLGIQLSGIPIGAVYTDEDELYKFPLNYGDRDSTTFKLSTPSTTLIPLVYKKQGYRITQADGWGTITTPYGSASCLRVVTTQYSIDTIIISSLPAPLNKFGFRNYVRSYQWLSLGEKIPYLEVSGSVSTNGNFIPNQVKYRNTIESAVGIAEQTTSTLALSVFPNPSNTELSIVIPQQNSAVNFEIVDLQGKLIKAESLGKNTELLNTHSIDVSEITKGIYFLNLYTNSEKQSLKISIQ